MTGVYRELQYSSDSGLGWSSLSSVANRPMRAGNAGPGGIVVNNETGPYLTFSSDGVTWQTLNNAIPGTQIGALVPGTPQVTTTKLINLQPTGVYHRAIGPAMGSAPWTFTAIAAPQRALVAAHPNVIQVGAEFWWFGAGNTYLVSPSIFTTWTQHSLPFTDVFADVAQGGGLVVAIASSRVAVCTDTTQHTWVSERLGLTNPVGIAFANNKFFVYSASQLAVREVLAVGSVVGCGAVGGTPGAVTQLAATIGDSVVTLAWQPPVSSGTSVVVGYAVRYRTSPSGAWTQFVAGPAQQAVVSGLTNGTAYNFEVVASNDVGVGVSAFVTETPNGPPALSPTDLTAIGSSPTVPFLNSILPVKSINGGFAWRLHDNTQFALSWTAAGGTTPLRYVVEMKSIHYSLSSGFPWKQSGNPGFIFIGDLFDIAYSGTTAAVRPLFDIYGVHQSTTLWNRNLLWSFRVQAITGDGPGAWSLWSTPATLMPDAVVTPPTPVAPITILPPPVVTAGVPRREHACMPWGSTTKAFWWDVVTVSWVWPPGIGATQMTTRVQSYYPQRGTADSWLHATPTYHSGEWATPFPADPAPIRVTPGITSGDMSHAPVRSIRLSDTSMDIYYAQRTSACSAVSVPAGGDYTLWHGPGPQRVRVILAIGRAESQPGEVSFTFT